MAIYSYVPKVIPGPMGTTYDFLPGKTTFTKLGKYEGRCYISIDDPSKIDKQWDEIDFKNENDILPDWLLNTLKQKKIEQINAEADKFDSLLKNESMVIKSSIGYTFNADIRTQINLLAILASGDESAEIATLDQSEPIKISLDQVKTLSKEITANGIFLYNQKWKKLKAIDEATTYDEIAAISTDFNMKDFTV